MSPQDNNQEAVNPTTMGQNIKAPFKSSKSTLKLLLVGIIVLIMLIPLAMVEGVIRERQDRNTQVLAEIAQTWAGEQTLAGPFLIVPFTMTFHDEKGASKTTEQEMTFLPQTLNTDVSVKPDVRKRGIFESVLYTSQIRLKGGFDRPVLASFPPGTQQVHWNESYLIMGVQEVKGLLTQPTLLWQQSKVPLQPGLGTAAYISSGMRAPVSLKIENPPASYAFELNLILNGSQSLQILPVGQQNQLHMASSWPSPSFIGNYLPVKRQLGPKGFEATWQVSYFARNFPQSWTGYAESASSLEEFRQQLNRSAYGVSLLVPVDFYHQSSRAVKYGILFLGFTFIAFFIFEMLTKLRIHAVQYVLVGLALALFYLLLVSLAEVMGFTGAYILASSAIVLMITSYTHGITRRANKPFLTGMMLIVLVCLYTYLYVLLSLEDLSLLFGTLGLMVALGILMAVTRNMDWE